MNLCLRFCNNEADALGVLNAAFLKVFTHISRYDEGKASIYTWIRSIVVKEALSFLNHSKLRFTGATIEEADQLQVEPEVFEKIKEADLLALVRKLPPSTMTVFNLFVMEGYSHREIAGMLSISEGTSKWHLNDARKKLQAMILKPHANN